MASLSSSRHKVGVLHHETSLYRSDYDCRIPYQKGWTADKKEMGYDYFWGSSNEERQAMAADHGLENPQPIMYETSDSGGYLCLFQSGTKYYIWNMAFG
jgi:hypothetical protein